jgi:hypothetical protein
MNEGDPRDWRYCPQRLGVKAAALTCPASRCKSGFRSCCLLLPISLIQALDYLKTILISFAAPAANV